MPSPPSYGCCTRVNFVLKKHLLFQMNLSNSGLKNRSIKEYWLIFTVLKFPLGLQFSHNLTKFKIIKIHFHYRHHNNYMYIFTAVNSGERCGPWASCLLLPCIKGSSKNNIPSSKYWWPWYCLAAILCQIYDQTHFHMVKGIDNAFDHMELCFVLSAE